MVLGGLLKKTLDSFLLTYVEGDFSVDLHIFGEHSIELHNLQLKCDVISKEFLGPSFPFKLESATIGSVLLDVPFSLGSRPVAAKVQNVVLVISCIDEQDWDEAELAREWFEYLIAEGDRVWNEQLAASKNSSSAPSIRSQQDNFYHNRTRFYTRFASKILDNTQVAVENVAVRLIGKAGHLTLSFDSFDLHTTDENWKRHFDADCDNTVFKLMDIKGLCVIVSNDTINQNPALKTGDTTASADDIWNQLADQKVKSGPTEQVLHSLDITVKSELYTAYAHGPTDPYRATGTIEFSQFKLNVSPNSAVFVRTLLGYLSTQSLWVSETQTRLHRSSRRLNYEKATSNELNKKIDNTKLFELTVQLLQSQCKQRMKSSTSFTVNEDAKLRFGEVVWVLSNWEFSNHTLKSEAQYVSSIISKELTKASKDKGYDISFYDIPAAVSSAGISWQEDVANALEATSVTCNGKVVQLFPAPVMKSSEFEVVFPEKGDIGLKLRKSSFWSQQAPIVQSCTPGYPAGDLGVIEPGMKIVALNGLSVDGLKSEQVTTLIHESLPRPLTVRLAGNAEAAKVASKFVVGSYVHMLRFNFKFAGVSIEFGHDDTNKVSLICHKTTFDVDMKSPAYVASLVDRLCTVAKVDFGLHVENASVVWETAESYRESSSNQHSHKRQTYKLLTIDAPSSVEAAMHPGFSRQRVGLTVSGAYRVTPVSSSDAMHELRSMAPSTLAPQQQSLDLQLGINRASLNFDDSWGTLLRFIAKDYIHTIEPWYHDESKVTSLLEFGGSEEREITSVLVQSDESVSQDTSTAEQDAGATPIHITAKMSVAEASVCVPCSSDVNAKNEEFVSISVTDTQITFGMTPSSTNISIVSHLELYLSDKTHKVFLVESCEFQVRLSQSDDDINLLAELPNQLSVSASTDSVKRLLQGISGSLNTLQVVSVAVEDVLLRFATVELVHVPKGTVREPQQPFERLADALERAASKYGWETVLLSNNGDVAPSASETADKYAVVRRKVIEIIGEENLEASGLCLSALRNNTSTRTLAKQLCSSAYGQYKLDQDHADVEHETIKNCSFTVDMINHFKNTRSKLSQFPGETTMEVVLHGISVDWTQAFSIQINDIHGHYITAAAGGGQSISDVCLLVRDVIVTRKHARHGGNLLDQGEDDVGGDGTTQSPPFLSLRIRSSLSGSGEPNLMNPLNQERPAQESEALWNRCSRCTLVDEMDDALLPKHTKNVQCNAFQNIAMASSIVDEPNVSSDEMLNRFMKSRMRPALSQVSYIHDETFEHHETSKAGTATGSTSDLGGESDEAHDVQVQLPVLHIYLQLNSPSLEVYDSDIEVIIQTLASSANSSSPTTQEQDQTNQTEPVPPADLAIFSQVACAISVPNASIKFKVAAKIPPPSSKKYGSSANHKIFCLVLEAGANFEACTVVEQNCEFTEIELYEVFLSLGTEKRISSGLISVWPEVHNVLEPCKISATVSAIDRVDKESMHEVQNIATSTLTANAFLRSVRLNLWTQDVITTTEYGELLLNRVYEIFGATNDEPVTVSNQQDAALTSHGNENVCLPVSVWSILFGSFCCVANDPIVAIAFQFSWRLLNQHSCDDGREAMQQLKLPVRASVESTSDTKNVEISNFQNIYVEISVKHVNIQILQNVMRSLSIKVDAFLPVLEIILSTISVEATSSSHFTDEYVVDLLFTMVAMFYNRRLAHWDPLIEPWERVHIQLQDAPRSLETMTKVRSMNRLNLNVSEDSIKTVVSLYDSMFPNKSSGSRNVTNNINHASNTRLSSLRREDYVVVNETGMKLSINKKYQIGANIPGILTIDLLGGWSYPNRLNWYKVFAVEFATLPSRTSQVIYTSPELNSKTLQSVGPSWTSLVHRNKSIDRQTVHDLSSIRLHLPGCRTNSMPEIAVRILVQPVKDVSSLMELRCTINLIPYLLGGVSELTKEWFQMFPIDSPKKPSGELLLQLKFAGDLSHCEHNSSDVQRSLGPNEACALSFTGAGVNSWFTDLNNNRSQVFQIMNASKRSVFRRLGLSMESEQGTEWRVPVDDPGKFILSKSFPEKKAYSSRQHNNASLDDGSRIAVTVVMRGGDKRLIRLRSPMVIKNNLPVPVELLICRSDDLDESQGFSGVGKLERIRLSESISVTGSGNWLAEANCGLTRALDGNPNTKWVDGGHRVEDPTDLLNATPQGKSWISIVFDPTTPKKICSYSIIPSLDPPTDVFNWTRDMIKRESRGDELGVYTGADPFSWVVRGRTEEGITAWKVLHRVSDFKFSATRQPGEFWLPAEVRDLPLYELRIDFKLRPLPFQTARVLSDVHKFPKSRIIGPGGGCALSLGGVELFRDSSHGKGMTADPNGLLCTLCGETTRDLVGSVRECWLCKSDLERNTQLDEGQDRLTESDKLKPMRIKLGPHDSFPLPMQYIKSTKLSDSFEKHESDVLQQVWAVYVRPSSFVGEFRQNWCQVFHDIALDRRTAKDGVLHNMECLNGRFGTSRSETQQHDNIPKHFSMHAKIRRKTLPMVSSSSDLSSSSHLVSHQPNDNGTTEQSTSRILEGSTLKVYLAPFMRIQNALPYSLKVTFTLDGEEQPAVCPDVILPGMEVPICNASRYMQIQFEVLGLNLVRSLPVPLFRSRLYELLGGEEAMNHRPKGEQDEEIALFHKTQAQESDTSRAACFLRLERQQDNSGTLQLTVYAETWIYNLSDVDILAQPANISVRDPESVDVYLPSSFGLVERSTSGQLSSNVQKRAILPALARSPTGNMKIAGILWQDQSVPQSRHHLVRNVQLNESDSRHQRNSSSIPSGDPEWNNNRSSVQWARQAWTRNWLSYPRLPEGTTRAGFYQSKWSPSFDTTTTLLLSECFSFSKGFGRIVAKREVGVEISRPSQHPFMRTTQIVIRSRYIIRNIAPNIGFEIRTSLPSMFKQSGLCGGNTDSDVNLSPEDDKTNMSREIEFNINTVDEMGVDTSRHNVTQIDDSQSNNVSVSQENGDVRVTTNDSQGTFVELPESTASETSNFGRALRARSNSSVVHEGQVMVDCGQDGLVHPFHFQGSDDSLWVRAFQGTSADQVVLPPDTFSQWSGKLSVKEEVDNVFRLRITDQEGSIADLYARITVRTIGSCTVIQMSRCVPPAEASSTVDCKNGGWRIPYEVRNDTPYSLEIWQHHTKVFPRFLLSPGCKLPIAWDEPDMERKVKVRVWAKSEQQKSKSVLNFAQNSTATLFDNSGKTSMRWKRSPFETKLNQTSPRHQHNVLGSWVQVSSAHTMSLDKVSELPRIRVRSKESQPVADANHHSDNNETPKDELLVADCDMDGATRVLTIAKLNTSNSNGEQTDGLEIDNKAYRVRITLSCENWDAVKHGDHVTVVCGSSLPKLVKLKLPRGYTEQHSTSEVQPDATRESDEVSDNDDDGVEIDEVDEVIPDVHLATNRLFRTPFNHTHHTLALKLWPGGSRVLEFTSNLPLYNIRISLQPKFKKSTWKKLIPSSLISCYSSGTKGDESHMGDPTNSFSDTSGEWISIPLSASLWAPDTPAMQVNSEEWNQKTRLDSDGILSSHIQAGDKPDVLGNGIVRLPRPGADESEDVKVKLVVSCDVSRQKLLGSDGKLDTSASGVADRSHFSLHISSIGISLLNASKMNELAYLCIQRLGLRASISLEATRLSMAVGSIQLDDMDPNARFPVVFAPLSRGIVSSQSLTTTKAVATGMKTVKSSKELSAISPSGPMLMFALTFFQTDPRIIHIGLLEFQAVRLSLSIDERFVRNLLSINHDGNLDQLVNSVLGSTGGGNSLDDNLVLHPSSVIVETFDTKGGTAEPVLVDGAMSQLLYIELCSLSSLHVHVRAELEGGKATVIDAVLDDSEFLKYIPVLNISDLGLKFTGWSKRNIVVSDTKLIRMLTRHYVLEGIKNVHKVLASSSAYGNPLSTGYRVFQGSRALVLEPIQGIRDSSLAGTIRGLQIGTSTLVLSMVNGATEMVNGVSGVLVDIVQSATDATGHDAITWPVSLTLSTIHQLSGAVARGTNKLRRDLMESLFVDQHIRAPRQFGKNGELLTYGPGNVPLPELIPREQQAARRLQRWYRVHRSMLSKHVELALYEATGASGMWDEDPGSREFVDANQPDQQRKPLSIRMWSKALLPVKTIWKGAWSMVQIATNDDEV